MNTKELELLDEALDYLNEKKKKDEIVNSRIRIFNATHKTNISYARNGYIDIEKDKISKADINKLRIDINLDFAKNRIKIYNVQISESQNHKYYIITF